MTTTKMTMTLADFLTITEGIWTAFPGFGSEDTFELAFSSAQELADFKARYEGTTIILSDTEKVQLQNPQIQPENVLIFGVSHHARLRRQIEEYIRDRERNNPGGGYSSAHFEKKFSTTPGAASAVLAEMRTEGLLRAGSSRGYHYWNRPAPDDLHDSIKAHMLRRGAVKMGHGITTEGISANTTGNLPQVQLALDSLVSQGLVGISNGIFYYWAGPR